jgi:hypothetical protein
VNAVALQIDAEAMRPIISAVVAETLAQLRADEAMLNGKLAYSEAEAAGLLGYRVHQLRDERLRGRVSASVGPRGRILYAKSDILAYLAARRWGPRG